MPCPAPHAAVFLDRDGVLTHSEVRAGKAYAPRRLEDFHILSEAGPALAALKAGGFRLVVVTNQPDVGNGLVARAVVEEMNRRLAAALPVDAVETCFHAQTEGCDCRKPRPGMLLAAAERLGIDLRSSVMVGDRWSDVAAGAAAGCYTILIDRRYAEEMRAVPDLVVDSLAAAAQAILARQGAM